MNLRKTRKSRVTNKVISKINDILIRMGCEDEEAYQYYDEIADLYNQGKGVQEIAETLYDNYISNDIDSAIEDLDEDYNPNDDKITVIISWPDDYEIIKDCYEELNNDILVDYPTITADIEEGIISLNGNENEINAIIEEISQRFNKFGTPDVQIINEPVDQFIDFPDTYELDNPENPTYSESLKQKAKIMKESFIRRSYPKF